MQAFVTLTGPAVAFRRPNIDTDVIIRIERLAPEFHESLKTYAFEALRYLPDGTDDPSFPLNRPEFAGAPILLAGANFGCGSSREGAVWALMALGIRCVIAPSFGDIFFNNCFENGVLAVVLDEARLANLAAATDDASPVTVDLRTCEIAHGPAAPIAFTVDPIRRESLLAGLDAIGLTLADAARIEAWQKSDRSRRPWIYDVPAGLGLAHDAEAVVSA